MTDSWSNWGQSRIVSREDIDRFGALTQNQQWIHVDDEKCRKESPYGNVIAHGFLILTLIPSLLPPESFLVVGDQQRIVRGCNWFRFPAPVYPGEQIQARAKLLETCAAKSGKGVILTRLIEIRAEKRKTPAVIAELLLQYF